MALFIDGPCSTIEDLTNQDSGLLEVCRTEQIDATTKLTLAQKEIAMELSALLAGQRSFSGHIHGPRRLTIGHVAVTSPLASWHVFKSLSLVYRDAYFNQLNDRYQAKWNEFEKLSKNSCQTFREIGVGLVLDPLARPGGPSVSTIPATEVGGIFYFAVTLLNATGEESTRSVAESFSLPNGTAANVAISQPEVNATGWNAYSGSTPTTMYVQNDSPLPLEESYLFFPSTAVTSGATSGNGQDPNCYRSLPRLMQRG